MFGCDEKFEIKIQTENKVFVVSDIFMRIIINLLFGFLFLIVYIFWYDEVFFLYIKDQKTKVLTKVRLSVL